MGDPHHRKQYMQSAPISCVALSQQMDSSDYAIAAQSAATPTVISLSSITWIAMPVKPLIVLHRACLTLHRAAYIVTATMITKQAAIASIGYHVVGPLV